jgi:hypothetical protein
MCKARAIHGGADGAPITAIKATAPSSPTSTKDPHHQERSHARRAPFRFVRELWGRYWVFAHNAATWGASRRATARSEHAAKDDNDSATALADAGRERWQRCHRQGADPTLRAELALNLLHGAAGFTLSA